MSHDHNHIKSQEGDKNILLAFTLNATFSIIELIGGYLVTQASAVLDG